MSKLFKRNKMLLLYALALSTKVYGYDFSGTYNGKNNIIKLQISNNQVQKVYAKCSEPDCDMNNSTKSLLLNHETTLVTELKTLEDNKKSIAYTTLILTPTNSHDKIQAVLVGYRMYFNPTKNDLKSKVEFTTSEILTRT